MSVRDRLGESSARYQRANPASSAVGRVMNVVGVVLFGSLLALGVAAGHLSMALLGVVGLVVAALAAWVTSLGRHRAARDQR